MADISIKNPEQAKQDAAALQALANEMGNELAMLHDGVRTTLGEHEGQAVTAFKERFGYTYGSARGYYPAAKEVAHIQNELARVAQEYVQRVEQTQLAAAKAMGGTYA